MLVRLRGWGDGDVLALLALFRKHLLYYIYACDRQFADVMRAELPDKKATEILEMVRSLMQQFGLRFSTKNFRTDVIVVTNGQEVYVYEHIYESIRLLPENKAGGVWLPDELSRFLQKAKQYRTRFTESQEKYFQQIQLWGKSIAETKSKFYALRDVYLKEKRRPRQRKEVEVTRLELLKEIFTDVPPVRRAEKTVVPSKTPKLWSSEQMETLLDYLVRITIQIQTTGSSDLVDHVAEALHRTDGSCVNKLADMRTKFLTKSSTVRAANLPASIFDPSTEVHKIFRADWSDNNDPYALGYLALKSRSLKLYSEINKKRRNKSIWARPKLRSATVASRGVVSTSTKSNGLSTQGTTPPATSSTIGIESRSNEEVAVSRLPYSTRAPTSTLPENEYSAFVRDIALQCRWTEKVVHNVLRCMQHSIDLYRSNKLVDFYYKIASLTPDVTFQDLFAEAQHILTKFEQRFGTLDGFENLILTVSGINSLIAPTDQETKEKDCALESEVSIAADTAVGENAVIACSSEEAIANGDEREYEQSPVGSPALKNSQATNDEVLIRGNDIGHKQYPGNEVTAINGDDHEQEQFPLLEPSAQTPQTGNEGADDEHSSSAAGKQSSPEDNWGDEADADADLDDDGLDSHSVGSSDNAWSGSSNISNTKNSDHRATDKAPLNNLYPLLGQYASGSSKKPSKRGKDEQYGKSFDLAKKRRLNEKNATVINNDDEDDDDEEEDGCYEDEDDDQSEDVDEALEVDVDSMSSDGELEESPHPLQNILDSMDSHLAELQEKQRMLIERKEDREWRQLQYAGREYGVRMSVQSFASER